MEIISVYTLFMEITQLHLGLMPGKNLVQTKTYNQTVSADFF